MEHELLARVTTKIHAPVQSVWEALVSPRALKAYLFGAEVTSDWREGRPITWRGEWLGKPYEDRGVILQVTPRQRLRFSHYSPRSGQPDVPGSYHTVTIELAPETDGTHVVATQDDNETDEARSQAEKQWGAMLASLKKYLEHPVADAAQSTASETRNPT